MALQKFIFNFSSKGMVNALPIALLLLAIGALKKKKKFRDSSEHPSIHKFLFREQIVF